jgi:hypothetical protein
VGSSCQLVIGAMGWPPLSCVDGFSTLDLTCHMMPVWQFLLSFFWSAQRDWKHHIKLHWMSTIYKGLYKIENNIRTYCLF